MRRRYGRSEHLMPCAILWLGIELLQYGTSLISISTQVNNTASDGVTCSPFLVSWDLTVKIQRYLHTRAQWGISVYPLDFLIFMYYHCPIYPTAIVFIIAVAHCGKLLHQKKSPGSACSWIVIHYVRCGGFACTYRIEYKNQGVFVKHFIPGGNRIWNLFLAQRSKSRSQCHWPWCHLKGRQ